jgi:zinc D-Ala-D-Ala dipeptidase
MQKPQDIIDLLDMAPSIMVAMAYASEDNFAGHKLPFYEHNVAYVTVACAEKLKKVQTECEQFGLGLKIFDAYRPHSTVLYLQNEWRYQADNPACKKRFYPALSKEDIFREGYIATRSSHSRASTVDLSLIELKTQKELDMGTEFDFFGDASHTINPNLSYEQQRNRLLLKSLMEKNDFINYEHEWWHYRLAHEPYPQTYFDFPIRIK